MKCDRRTDTSRRIEQVDLTKLLNGYMLKWKNWFPSSIWTIDVKERISKAGPGFSLNESDVDVPSSKEVLEQL